MFIDGCLHGQDGELGAVDATEMHSEQTATADVPTVVPVVEPPASLPVTTQSKPSSQALQQVRKHPASQFCCLVARKQ